MLTENHTIQPNTTAPNGTTKGDSESSNSDSSDSDDDVDDDDQEPSTNGAVAQVDKLEAPVELKGEVGAPSRALILDAGCGRVSCETEKRNVCIQLGSYSRHS